MISQDSIALRCLNIDSRSRRSGTSEDFAFELMEPVGDSGVIADFLDARGEGLHHVAFAVGDVDETVRALGARGVQFVAERPEELALDVIDFAGRPFSEELRFAFSHPKSLLGVLFEFIEYPPGYATP